MVEAENKYERARIVGARSLQISMGAPFLIKMTNKDLEKVRFDPISIALMELEKGVIPIDIKRREPYKKKE